MCKSKFNTQEMKVLMTQKKIQKFVTSSHLYVSSQIFSHETFFWNRKKNFVVVNVYRIMAIDLLENSEFD